MVVVGTGGIGEAVIKTKYPVERGLTAGTQKQTGDVEHLIPEKSSLVLSRKKEGI